MEDRSYVSANQTRGIANIKGKAAQEAPAAGAAAGKKLQPLAIGCVFDGHNGDYVAEMLKNKFAVFKTAFVSQFCFIGFLQSTFCEALDKFELSTNLAEASIMLYFQ